MMNSTLTKNQPSYHILYSPYKSPFLTPNHSRNLAPTLSKLKCHVNAVKSRQTPSPLAADEVVLKQEVKSDNAIGRKLLITGATSVGFMLIMMSLGHDKALAFGPEGPLMEEFWENVRRYFLYALTVSTGVLYSVLQPIYELLRNPISAILVLVIVGGTFYIGSQVLYAMVGISDFDYQYAY